MTRQQCAPPCLGASEVARWARQARAVAGASRELVDSLNVFPVPDADTGTNVWLTLCSATEALEVLPAGADAAQVARALADGALRGARGNSGLLVSQALSALADVAAQAPHPEGLRPVELVAAYERMARDTRAAISRPVEGTLLTVAADAATAARAALGEQATTVPATVASVSAAAALGAQESVVETGGLGHGPVDAGGAALMLMLTALSDVLATCPGEGGAAAETAASLTGTAHQMLTDLAAGGASHTTTGAEGMSLGEFEVMYLLEATSKQAHELRATLEQVGDSVGVVGTPDALGVGLYQVHVHTSTPRAALPGVGRARQICVRHLHHSTLLQQDSTAEPHLPWSQAGVGAKVVSFEPHRERGGSARRQGSPTTPHPTGQRVGVVACTRAPGLVEQLARTGAVVVLDPDKEGIVRAVADLGATHTLVLPCDPQAREQAHLAASQVQARAAATGNLDPAAPADPGAPGASPSPQAPQLEVAGTEDEARVLAAAVAVAGQPLHGSAQEAAYVAERAAARLRTITLDAEQAEPDRVAATLTAALRHGDELVTVVLGRHAAPDVGELVNNAVSCEACALGEVEVVVHAGGQVSPEVLVAIE